MELCTVTTKGHRATASVEEGIMMLDGDGCIPYIDDTAASLLGRRPEEVQGAKLVKLLRHGAEEGDDVMEALQSGGRMLYRAPQGNGTIVPVEIRFHRIDCGGEPERYIAVVRNLDAVEQMEQDLKNQLCRERLFKECISHHFFNPLCIAQGYLQLVLNREGNGDEEAMLEATRQALARIETVVKNVVYSGDLRE